MNEVDIFCNSILDPNIDYFSESLGLGKVRLYHGSDEKLKMLKPIGLDLGNTFNKPGWSIFTFKNYDYAATWAAYVSLKKGMRYLYSTDRQFKRDIDKYFDTYMPVAYDTSTNEAVLCQDIIPALFKSMNGLVKYYYVYTMDVDRKYVSIGNDSTLDEYTVRTEVIPTKIDKYAICKENISDIFKIVSYEEYNNSLSRNANSFMRRGFLSLFMNRDFEWYGYHASSNNDIRILYQAITDKKLKPGMDIEEWCYNRGIDLPKISIIDRLSMQHLVNKKLGVIV